VLQFPGDAAGIFRSDPIVAALNVVEHLVRHRRSWEAETAWVSPMLPVPGVIG
jgi:hypothetical protein